MRLGLTPFDDIKQCLCGTPLSTNPLHFLSCSFFRSSIIARHDRLLQVFHKIGNTIGIAVQIEPHLALGDEGTRSDGQFFFPAISAHTDISVVHPSAPSYLNLANRPRAAILKKETEKNTLYAYAAQCQGALFFPIIFDSFGTFGPSAINFISKLADEAISSGKSVVDDQHIKPTSTVPSPFAYNQGMRTFFSTPLAYRELELVI